MCKNHINQKALQPSVHKWTDPALALSLPLVFGVISAIIKGYTESILHKASLDTLYLALVVSKSPLLGYC